ncbi:Hep_Hag [Gallibacterium anatis]|uniref:Hep_Hag n=1 Tax=Gallibacterium anatis TaxID=750 RepID=A0A377H7F6_9PAST|nr:YadA-like family protein [Gallibacterium anatis]KGQ54242.1 hypothetical protein IE01_10175 [Gallibacterium anatis DSM 16844 = F 149]STO38278.1 Hep_Hag [Gallibacterium anatis]
MNHIFRVIFDKTRNQFIAVSELTKSRGKSISEKRKSAAIKQSTWGGVFQLTPLYTAVVVLGLLGGSQTASANNVYTYWGRIGTTNCSNADYSVSLSIKSGQNDDTQCQSNYGVSIGYGSWIHQSAGEHSVLVGAKSTILGSDSVAVGYQVTTNSEVGQTVLGSYSKGLGQQAVVVGQRSSASSQAVAVGANVYASGDSSIAIGNDDLIGSSNWQTSAYSDKLPKTTIGSIYSGLWASSAYFDSQNAFNSSYNTVVNGKDYRIFSPTYAAKTGAIAIGSRTVAGGEVSTALGSLSFALAPKSTAVGIRAFVASDAEGGTAIGRQSRVFSANSVAIGNLTEATETGTVAYGYKAYAVGDNSMALGNQVVAGSYIQNGGDFIQAYNNQANGSISDIPTVKAAVDKYFADRPDGQLTQKTGDAYLTIGSVDIKKSSKNGSNVVVLGNNSAALKDNSIALGYGTLVDAVNSLGLGSYNYIVGVADNTVVVGLNNRVLSGTGAGNNIIVGLSNIIGASSSDSVLIGSAINLGATSRASIMLGKGTSIGNNAWQSVAIGQFSSVGNNATNSVAFGVNSSATAASAMAFGVQSSASIANSVALGYQSRTDYTTEAWNTKAWAAKGAITVPSSEKTGIISVGSKGQERRITNVASGALDTDAVNVAQLRTITDTFETQLANLSDGGGVQYLSIERKNSTGAAGELAGKLEKTNNYQKYVEMKTQLEYLNMRKDINNENFNEEAFNEYKAEVEELGALYNNQVSSTATSLASIDAQIASAKRELGGMTEGDAKEAKRQQLVAQIKAAIENAQTQDEARTMTGALSNDEATAAKADTNYNNDGAKGDDSIAFGWKANTAAASDGSVGGKHGIALGFEATVMGENSIAIGGSENTTKNTASGKNSIAIGTANTVNGEQSISVGYKNTVSGSHSGAFGDPTIINADNSYSVGNNNNISAANTFVLGNSVTASQANSVYLGNNTALVTSGTAGATTEYPSATVNGVTYNGFAGTTPVGVVTVGRDNQVRRIQGVAAGKISSDSTDAINGSQLYSVVNALGANTITLTGNNSSTTGAKAISSNPSFAITGDGKILTATAAAAGVSLALNTTELAKDQTLTSTFVKVDGSNLPTDTTQLNTWKTKLGIGDSVNWVNVNSTAPTDLTGSNYNKENSGAKGTDSIAIGNQAGAIKTATNGIAIGYAAKANGVNSVALGAQITATNEKGNAIAIGNQAGTQLASSGTAINSLGLQSVSIGQNSYASGDTSIAIGSNAGATGENAVAFGTASVASGSAAFASGQGSTAGADSAVAIGQYANVSVANSMALGANSDVDGDSVAVGSVALGANSSVDAGVHTSGIFSIGGENTTNTVSAKPTTDSVITQSTYAQLVQAVSDAKSVFDADTTNTEKRTAYTTARVNLRNATTNKNSVLSVGSEGNERQIQNVAAGVISATSTDAINGSQLYYTNTYLTNLATTVKTKFGGNAALNADTGEITFTNIGDTGKDNIHDAIKAATAVVKAGDNIAVTKAADSNTYTVALDDTTKNKIAEIDNKANASDLAGKAGTNLSNITSDGKDVITGLVKAVNNDSYTTVSVDDTENGTNGQPKKFKIGVNVADSISNTSTENTNKIASAQSVYNAVTEAKTEVTKVTGEDNLLDLTKTAGDGLTKDSYALSVSKSKLTTALSDTFAKTDASNLQPANVTAWKQKLGVDTLESNTFKLTGDNSSSTSTQTLNKSGGLSFAITGNSDITTAASGDGVALSLNKATEVTEGDTKAVTSGAVYKAINSLSSTLNFSGDTTTGTPSVNLKDGTLAVNGANYITTTANGSSLTVKLTDEAKKKLDGLSEDGKLTLKANNSGNTKVTLTDGVNFINGTNTTATVDSTGVKFDVNNKLYNMTSLTNGATDNAAGATTLSLSDTGVTLNSKKLSGLANGTVDADAVNLSQLKSIATDLGGSFNTPTGAYTAPTYEAINGAATAPTSTNNAINSLITAVNGGLIFSGNTGTATTRQLGSTLNIVGAGTATATGADTSGAISQYITTTASDGNIAIDLTQAVKEKLAKISNDGNAVSSTQTIKLGGDSASVTDAQTLGQDGGIKFDITQGDSSITTNASGSSVTVQVADGGITTAKLADNAVTEAKLANDSVTTGKIKDANVTTAKLADSAVTEAKLANDSVTTGKIKDANVTTAKLADSAVTDAKLATNAVTTDKITDKNVTKAKLADDVQTSLGKADSALQGLTIGADTNASAAGIALSQANNRFDIVGDKGVTTSVDGNQIKVSLTQSTLTKGDNGQITAGNTGNAYATANTVATAINSAIGALGDNTLTLTGDSNSKTTAQTLNKLGGLSFAITGNDDITTKASGSSVALSLNKATSVVASTETDGSKVVTSGAVYSAVSGAKTIVSKDDTTTDNLATVTGTKSDGISGDTYKVAVTKSAVVNALGDTFAKKDASNMADLTDDQKTAWKQAIGLDRVSNTSELSYTANSNETKKKVAFTDGLNFTDGTNTTAEVGDNGVVKFNVKPALTGITSISNGTDGTGASITLGDHSITLSSGTNGTNGATLTGLTKGSITTNSTDAINGSQLYSLAKTVLGVDPETSNIFAAPTFKQISGNTVAPTDFNTAITQLISAVNTGIGVDADNNSKQTVGANEQISIIHAGTTAIIDNGTNYVGTNLRTKVSKANGTTTVELGLSENPVFNTVKVGGGNGVTINSTPASGTGTSAQPATITFNTPAADGQPSTAVQLKNVADPTDATDAANKNYVDTQVKTATDAAKTEVKGTGSAVVTSTKATDGHSIYTVHVDQTTAYVDSEGNTLTKYGDNYYTAAAVNGKKYVNGQWYSATDIGDDGQPKTGVTALTGDALPTAATVAGAKLLNPDATTTAPVSLANIASGLGLTGAADNGASGNLSTPAAINADAAQKVIAGKKKGGSGADKDTIIVDQDGKSGIYALSGAILNKVTTLGDLQAVAQAGLDFTGSIDATADNKGLTIHRPLGTALNLIGAKDADAGLEGKDKYDAKNLATFVDATNHQIQFVMKKAPSFEALTLQGAGTNTPKVVFTPGGTTDKPTVTLSNGGADAKPVEIKGVANGTADDSAVNLAQLNKVAAQIGMNGKDGTSGVNGVDGADGVNGTPAIGQPGVPGKDGKDGQGLVGPAGQDGMNGTTIVNKVQGLRDGVAGTLVYTDAKGNRVLAENGKYYDTSLVGSKVKANNGLWYDADKVNKDGSVNDTDAKGSTLAQLNDASIKAKNGDKSLGNDKVILSAVNPDGKTTAPVTIANLKHNLTTIASPTDDEVNDAVTKLGLDPDQLTDEQKASVKSKLAGEKASKEVAKLLKLDGSTNADIAAQLKRAVTLRDLQTVAQAGLIFMGNDGVNIHRALGETFKILGSGRVYTKDAKPETAADLTKAYSVDYSADNLITHADGTDTVRIEMKKLPHFEGIILNGKNGDDGESGKDGKDGFIGVNDKGEVVVINGVNGKDGTKGKDGEPGRDGVDGQNGSKIITEKDINGTGDAGVKLSYKASGDGADATAKTTTLKEGLTFNGDDNIKTSTETGGVVNVKLSDKLTGIDSIGGKAGEGSLDFGSRDKTDADGKTVKDEDGNVVKEKTIDAGGSVITNVAVPTQNTDAANKGYVDSEVSKVKGDVTNINTNISNIDKTLAEGLNVDTNGKPQKINLGNTIKVKNGINTSVSDIKKESDGVFSYTINVNGIPMSYVNKNGDTLAKVGDKFVVLKPNGEVDEKKSKDPLLTKINGMKVVTPEKDTDMTENAKNNGLTIDNVGNGKVAEGSKQAVNGGQLHATAQSVADVLGNDFENKDGKVTVKNGTDGIGGTGKTTISDAFKEVVKRAKDSVEVIGDNSNIIVDPRESGGKKTYTVKLKQDITVDNSITIGQGKVKLTSEPADTNKPAALNVNGARITGVADGVDKSDVATVGQVERLASGTTKAISQVNKRVDNLTKESRGGIAGAMATAGLQQTTQPGRTTVSVGTATFKGESAVALGFSKLSDNGKVGIRLSGMTTSSGDTGGSFSVGYTW